MWHKKKDIESEKQHINELFGALKEHKTFTTSDIRNFYWKIEPGLPESTINWRVYSLVQEGVVVRVGKGKFAFGKGNYYVPEISNELKLLYEKIRVEFPYLNICLWNTSFFNEFMKHQPGHFFVMVEVEKDAIESVFYFLKENKYPVFAEPSKEIVEKYLPSGNNAVIVKSLITEAPLQNAGIITTITLEKILVDIFCDEVLFAAQQGHEMRTIYEEAFGKYSINRDKMLRYAQRRNRRKALQTYIESISNNRQYK